MSVRNWLLAGVRGLGLAVVAIAGSVTLFVLSVVSIALTVIGVGAITTPWVLTAVRAWANWRRSLAAHWGGVRIPAVYRPFPADLTPGPLGHPRKTGLMLRDPATWWDLRWLAVDMTAGFVTALLPAVLVCYPVEGYVIAAGLWRAFSHHGEIGYWYGFVPVSGQLSALGAALLGTVLALVGMRINPLLLTAHFRLAGAVMAPREVALAARVEELTESRSDAVDTSAAELRRIERDLHDGAQARLVAMGMSLGTIEALMESDPAQAKAMLARARSDSAEALTELRDLVRGIHPPVLAERGLPDAVRALALRLPLPVEVTGSLPGRAPAPVESAAYFGASEILTNAVKHSGASRLWVDLSYDGGALRLSVTDNGRGGADPAGSGLRGVERRLGTFDGVMAVSSPAGGPTMVTMEIPCALSSPKTSSSSATDS
ncbi:hypothetical protein SRB5_12650 [Streptomyces sp. RB5]|uniref:histidine kinase n=1 Tax=Streptomyces smaragdinus TaxID=2585196 RepID=A0A7K0CCH7_9ACTN|nr:sensor domain-containing protein [Streptomyces smaragdinus]MQY11151.1 hypothetical protein [Streptomyces smaragdinus]